MEPVRRWPTLVGLRAAGSDAVGDEDVAAAAAAARAPAATLRFGFGPSEGEEEKAMDAPRRAGFVRDEGAPWRKAGLDVREIADGAGELAMVEGGNEFIEPFRDGASASR